MGIFGKNQIINYQKKEIERLESNLKKLSNGDFDIDLEVSVGDSSVRAERDKFIKMNQYILKIKKTFSGLVTDTEDFASNIEKGNLGHRIDTTRYNGLYSRIGKDINASLESISEPLNEANTILEKIALNDYTLTMSAGYEGDFAMFANSINDVQKKLLYIQDIIEEISLGDISELENIKRTGLYSENDCLTPAFINMMETIQEILDETEIFVEETLNGNLNARREVEKYKVHMYTMGFNRILTR